MSTQSGRQFKHVYRLFSKDRLKHLIGDNHFFIFGVLQIVFLYVGPNPFCDLPPCETVLLGKGDQLFGEFLFSSPCAPGFRLRFGPGMIPEILLYLLDRISNYITFGVGGTGKEGFAVSRNPLF